MACSLYTLEATYGMELKSPLHWTFFFKASDKLEQLMKKVRVNRRQCKANDTVRWIMSKPRGPKAKYKNKFNH